MNKLIKLTAIAAGLMALALSFAGQAHATAITCGNAALGTRTVTVDPALVGGYCYAQNGNFNGDDFSGLGPGGADLDLLLKNGDWGLSWGNGATSGSWSFDADLWNQYDNLFLGFHFGGGGECNPDADSTNNPNDVLPGPDCGVDPDSFIIELESANNSGTWQADWGTQWGLSNIYLLGYCDDDDDCITTRTVPEPSSIALLALGVAGLGFARRRKR